MAGKAKCRSCDADILWMKTVNGKNIPVDFDDEIEKETEFDRDRMTVHFESCPNSDAHRKAKAAPRKTEAPAVLTKDAEWGE